MASRSSTTGDPAARAWRFLATILLMGGLAAGPMAHLAPAADDSPLASSRAGHHDRDHVPPAPDAHHDCPICITLANGTAPMVAAIPASLLSRHLAPPSAEGPLPDVGSSDDRRARAPPHA